jgi:hypothetical protein
MPELSATVLVIAPLLVLVYAALYLVRFGMTAAELAESSRQRLAGVGMLLLYLAVVVCVIVLGSGLYYLFRILKI